MTYKILFNDNEPISPKDISAYIENFGYSYTKVVTNIIRETDSLDLNFGVFIKNSARQMNGLKIIRCLQRCLGSTLRWTESIPPAK